MGRERSSRPRGLHDEHISKPASANPYQELDDIHESIARQDVGKLRISILEPAQLGEAQGPRFRERFLRENGVRIARWIVVLQESLGATAQPEQARAIEQRTYHDVTALRVFSCDRGGRRWVHQVHILNPPVLPWNRM
jgi:hypothetical protein